MQKNSKVTSLLHCSLLRCCCDDQ